MKVGTNPGDACCGLKDQRSVEGQPPTADGPGVPRGRFIPEGDGGGPRALSQDGTKPIGGRKNHPGSPPRGAS